MDSHLAHQRPGPRLYHKKSRLGCIRCKARRVKCDEKRPACSGCSRHLVECVYSAAPGRLNNRHESEPLRLTSGTSSSPSGTTGSRTRRRSRMVVAAAASSSKSTKRNGEPTNGGHVVSSSDDDRFLVSGYQAAALETDQGQDKDQDDLDGLLDPAESRTRRLTELRLLHNYLMQQSWTFGQAPIPAARDEQDPFIWAVDLVGRAVEGDGQDSILYTLLAHSALNLWVSGKGVSGTPSDRKTRSAHRLLHRQYLALALRAQRRAVVSLLATPANSALGLADAVGTASVLLVNHSFALVQTLPVEPWQPPHEWLQMGRGAMQVMEVAKGYLAGTLEREKKRQEDAAIALTGTRGTRPPHLPPPPRENIEYPSLVTKLLLASPRFDRAEMFSPVWAAPYLWLLEEPVADQRLTLQDAGGDGAKGGAHDDPDGTDDTSFAPYYATLAYIGWCAAAIARPDEPVNAICRRLAGAAYWFPGALEERLRQQRPRAMVCLAQYFALWVPFEPGRSDPASGPGRREVWMMGTAGRRQVAAIHAALPERWKSKVAQLLEGHRPHLGQ